MNEYDYEYELTDDQLIHYSSLSAASKLQWLDEARRFTLLARKARFKEEPPANVVRMEPDRK